MADKEAGRFTKILQRLTGSFDFSKVDKKALNSTDDRKGMRQITVVSELERSKILENAARLDTSNMQMNGQYSGLLQYIQGTMSQSATERVENERIMRMVPEFSQARDIMISTLMQPNNLMEDRITIECNMDVLPADIRQKISDYISEFFESYFDLSTTLPDWTNEAMYLSGAKPLFILPLKAFSGFLDQPHREITKNVPVLESFSDKHYAAQRDKFFSKESLFGFSDAKLKAPSEKILETYAQNIATESFSTSSSRIAEFASESVDNAGEPIKRARNFDVNKATKESAKFAQGVIASIEVVDNPGIAAFADLTNQRQQIKMRETVMTQYAEASLLKVGGNNPDNDPIGRPILLQPPTESVIPLYTPGTPNDPFGYMIVVSPTTGHFINLSDRAMYGNSDINSSGLPGDNTFGQLFSAFGYSSLASASTYTLTGQNLMAALYQDVLEAHIKRTAANAGFADIKIGAEPSVVKCLFARYLQQRKTTLLFVPANLMIYYHFKTGPNGTGVSKLDDSKFILSLRITLLVCRMMTAFNQAIDRRTLGITFPEKFRANPIEHLNILKQQYVMKSAVSFSPWPETTAEQLVSKGITVKAENMPGLQNFQITNEPNDQQRVMPDTQLADDVKNLSILSTDVPAYALNNMGEQEYSRSIATTDLAFARRIVKSQRIICKHMTNFVRTWCLFDNVIISDLKRMVAKDMKDLEQSNDPGVADVDKDGNVDIGDVIASLKVTLPSPVVAPTKAQFENVTSMMSTLDDVLAGMYPDALAMGNQELEASVGTIRAFLKQLALDGYIDKLGLGDVTIPDIRELPLAKNTHFAMLLNNFRNAVVELNELAKKKDTSADQGGGFGAPDMSGGMGGGDMGMGDGTDMSGGDMGTQPTPDDSASADAGGGDEGIPDLNTATSPGQDTTGGTPGGV